MDIGNGYMSNWTFEFKSRMEARNLWQAGMRRWQFTNKFRPYDESTYQSQDRNIASVFGENAVRSLLCKNTRAVAFWNHVEGADDGGLDVSWNDYRIQVKTVVTRNNLVVYKYEVRRWALARPASRAFDLFMLTYSASGPDQRTTGRITFYPHYTIRLVGWLTVEDWYKRRKKFQSPKSQMMGWRVMANQLRDPQELRALLPHGIVQSKLA